MPTIAPARLPAPDLGRSLGSDAQEEYRRLLHVLGALRGRFAFIPVESALRPETRDRLLQRLASELADAGMSLRIVRLTRDAWDITAHLDGEGAHPDEVLVVIGLEDTPRMVAEVGARDCRPPALAILNHAREMLRHTLGRPLLLWCDPLSFTAVQEHAPDLFDHFAALFRFEDAGRPERPVLAQQTTQPLQQAERPAMPGAAAAAAFYQERLAELPDPGPERARALLGLAEALLSSNEAGADVMLCQAQEAASEALGMLDAGSQLGEWARAQDILGKAYHRRRGGNRAENLLRAIACYERALRVYTEADFPEDWAGTHNNLGNAYADLPTGNRVENLRRAIACYETALQVFTEADFPQHWAMAENNLGIAYADLPTGDRAENLRRAIACYEAALRVRTETEFPMSWAATQNNLGNGYADLPTGDRARNLRRAIACYEAALQVFTEADFAIGWAGTQNNLGTAYAALPTGDRTRNLRQAIACFEAALRVRTEAGFPEDWAMTQHNLGLAHARVPTGARVESLRHAITCYEAALRVRTEAEFPQDWAGTLCSLGLAYARLPAGDRARNLRQATACFEAALRVYTEEEWPERREQALQNLRPVRARLDALTRRRRPATPRGKRRAGSAQP